MLTHNNNIHYKNIKREVFTEKLFKRLCTVIDLYQFRASANFGQVIRKASANTCTFHDKFVYTSENFHGKLSSKYSEHFVPNHQLFNVHWRARGVHGSIV